MGPSRDLADRRRLSGAVNADEQDDLRIVLEDVRLGRGEGGGHLVGQHIEDGVGIGKGLALGLVTQILDDRIGSRSADIGEDEGLLELIPKVVIDVGPAVEQDVHLLAQARAGTGQSLVDLVEETHLALLARCVIEFLADDLRDAIGLH